MFKSQGENWNEYPDKCFIPILWNGKTEKIPWNSSQRTQQSNSMFKACCGASLIPTTDEARISVNLPLIRHDFRQLVHFEQVCEIIL